MKNIKKFFKNMNYPILSMYSIVLIIIILILMISVVNYIHMLNEHKSQTNKKFEDEAIYQQEHDNRIENIEERLNEIENTK